MHACTNRASGVKFAVKLLPVAGAEACVKEVEICQGLQHPNVIHCHDLYYKPGALCIVFDWYACDLEHALQGCCCKPAVLVSLMQQMAASVAYVHGKGVVHRDIKEANFLVTVKF